MPNLTLPGTTLSAVSRTRRNVLENKLAATDKIGAQSYSYAVLGNATVLNLFPTQMITLHTETTVRPYFQYPKGSVARTSDEISILIKTWLPWANVLSRLPTDPYEGPWPLILVSPLDQFVYSVFTGLAGNPAGLFNKYCVKYIGLNASQDILSVQTAESKLWYDIELIIRAFKKDQFGNLNCSVVRAGDEMIGKYAEDGPYIYWRQTSYIGMMLIVSVFETYRPYNL